TARSSDIHPPGEAPTSGESPDIAPRGRTRRKIRFPYWRVVRAWWALRRFFVADATADPGPPPILPSAKDHIPAARSDCFDVVCLPIIEWDFRFQRPQQLMTRFAAAGHRVFYVAQRFREGGPAWQLRPKAERIWEVSFPASPRNVYRDSLDESSQI